MGTLEGNDAVREIATESILGYSVTTESRVACLDIIVEWIESDGRGRYLVCANPHSIHVAQRDQLFRHSFKHADLVVPDGAGVVLASRILDGNIKERITGSDIFFGLSDIFSRRGGGSFFFLGSTTEVLEQIERRMMVDYPQIRVVGSYSPPFRDAFSEGDNKKMVEIINEANPDVLWVGMTAPKQEKWIYENRDRLNVKFIGAIGAVFDFYAGRIKRAHPVFQKYGMEWFPRLLREPRRLWRRNFISNPSFVFKVIRTRINNR